MGTVKVPADVELADTLAFGLTARQLLLLAATGISAYGSYLLLAPLLPTPLALAAAVVVAAAGLLLALGRHQGMSGDQLALAVGRHLRTPKLRLLAPDGLPGPRTARAVPLDLPVRRVLESGLVELGDGDYRLLVAAHDTSFELRSPPEQQAFVDCFARFLDSRNEPFQLLVRSEPASLDPQAGRLDRLAADLPSELAAAVGEHARFLHDLTRTTTLTRRQVLLVVGSRQRDPELALAALARQAAEAGQLLAGAQIQLRPLDGAEAVRLLAAALDPPGPAAGSNLEGVIRVEPASAPASH